MKNHKALAATTVIFLMVNVLIGAAYVRMSRQYGEISKKHFHCTELIKAWDNLLQEQNTDYIEMSRLAVKHVNSEQLNLSDLPVYDRLVANNETLSEWHDRITTAFHNECE